MSVLVLADHDNHAVKASTLSALSAARAFSGPVRVLVAGFGCQGVAEALSSYADEVLLADHQAYEFPLAESITPLLLSVVSSASHILAPATTSGKNILPRVAALLDVAQISEVVEVVDERTFVRPIYAGNALVTVQSQNTVQVMTVRPTAFSPAEPNPQQGLITTVDFVAENTQSSLLHQEKHGGDRPELASAEWVIAGGRGVQNEAGFQRLMAIADRMGAAVGASRAAVDAGFAPNDFQVGQTGQVVAPKVYIAVGVSGAIQHLAGMKESEVIVAINKDPDAPIFEVADYGLVGDLALVFPEWEAWLTAQGY